MALSLQDIITGITSLSCPLLNYFILIGKMHILDCRRTHAHPNIDSFKLKSKLIIKQKNTLPQEIKTWELTIRNGIKTFHSYLGCFSLSLCISNNYNYCISFPNNNCI